MSVKTRLSDAIAARLPPATGRPLVNHRIVGDSCLLVEYGEMVLDLNLRIRVYSLCNALTERDVPGMLEMSPGVRSVLLTYDPLVLPLRRLLNLLRQIETELPESRNLVVPSRIVRLPLAFHDRWTQEAVERYMRSVRSEAPYLPDNVDFVARCNGLDGPAAVSDALTTGYKMVLGLGDVYLGAPCAVPLNPLTRIVVPKYNPARMFTPEGAVGIGGSYICIYPMESPGGYQLVGRTLPIWNTFQSTQAFAAAPWLLETFDRIEFNLVDESELEAARADMFAGRYDLQIENGEFDVAEYNRDLDTVEEETEEFKRVQREAALVSTEGY